MKTAFILSLILASASAFAPLGRPQQQSVTSMQEKINSKIELESPKVVNNEEVAAGEKKVFCRCWKSGTFPLCDAAHVEHNKENGKLFGRIVGYKDIIPMSVETHLFFVECIYFFVSLILFVFTLDDNVGPLIVSCPKAE